MANAYQHPAIHDARKKKEARMRLLTVVRWRGEGFGRDQHSAKCQEATPTAKQYTNSPSANCVFFLFFFFPTFSPQPVFKPRRHQYGEVYGRDGSGRSASGGEGLVLQRSTPFLAQRSKYPMFEVSGSKNHTLNGFKNQKPQMFGTWTL